MPRRTHETVKFLTFDELKHLFDGVLVQRVMTRAVARVITLGKVVLTYYQMVSIQREAK